MISSMLVREKSARNSGVNGEMGAEVSLSFVLRREPEVVLPAW
jgi:hypothetical protein